MGKLQVFAVAYGLVLIDGLNEVHDILEHIAVALAGEDIEAHRYLVLVKNKMGLQLHQCSLFVQKRRVGFRCVGPKEILGLKGGVMKILGSIGNESSS